MLVSHHNTKNTKTSSHLRWQKLGCKLSNPKPQLHPTIHKTRIFSHLSNPEVRNPQPGTRKWHSNNDYEINYHITTTKRKARIRLSNSPRRPRLPTLAQKLRPNHPPQRTNPRPPPQTPLLHLHKHRSTSTHPMATLPIPLRDPTSGHPLSRDVRRTK